MYSVRNYEKLAFWIMAFSFMFLLMAARRPDVIFNAQPWAEDGAVWIKGIYTKGFFNSLFLPQDGYFQTIPRLTYGIALCFGIAKAALVSNVISISLRIFFLMFLLSRRFSFIDIKFRIAAVIYFILMPNVSEGFVNITNVHWYISMYLLSVIIATPPENYYDKIHDFTVLILCGLSGPFVIFLAPSLIIRRYVENGGIINAIKSIKIFDIVMAFCCFIQIVSILNAGGGSRSPAPLGASFELLSEIITRKLVFGAFFDNTFSILTLSSLFFSKVIFVALVLLIAYSIFTSSWRVSTIALFPIIMLAFALAKPMIDMTHPQWPPILNPGVGERYFFITNFCFFIFILFLINKLKTYKNIVIMLFMALITPALLISFNIPKLADVGYREDILKFQNAPSGESVNIRINPPGWSFDLIKK